MFYKTTCNTPIEKITIACNEQENVDMGKLFTPKHHAAP